MRGIGGLLLIIYRAMDPAIKDEGALERNRRLVSRNGRGGGRGKIAAGFSSNNFSSWPSVKLYDFIPSNYMEVLAVSDKLLIFRKAQSASDLVKAFLHATLA